MPPSGPKKHWVQRLGAPEGRGALWPEGACATGHRVGTGPSQLSQLLEDTFDPGG